MVSSVAGRPSSRIFLVPHNARQIHGHQALARTQDQGSPNHASALTVSSLYDPSSDILL